MTFATGAQTVGGVPENASATFDINTNSITVHLLNLSLDPSNVTQAIGSLRFTITGASGTLTPTMGANPASDTKFGIDSGGLITSPTAETTTIWSANLLSTTDFALCVVCVGGGTTGLILGGPDGSDAYSAADGTLKPSASGQWIIGSGLTYAAGQKFAGFDTSPDWLINFGAGVDLTNVVITNVIFGFGEGGVNNDYGSQFIEMPEPGSVILFGTGLGLLAIAAGARRLRRR